MNEQEPTGDDKVTSSIRRHSVRLGLFALGTALLLSLVSSLTAEKIIEQQVAAERRALGEVLPPTRHDNDLLDSAFTLEPGAARWEDIDLLGLSMPRQAYLARSDGRPSGVILPVETVEGYSGTIVLLVGIDTSGAITGVRVIQHSETPGLGDKLELRKSDWILDFDGRALGDPPSEGWQVRKDGGEFDAFVGATITPRAVVGAVYDALRFFEANREALLN